MYSQSATFFQQISGSKRYGLYVPEKVLDLSECRLINVCLWFIRSNLVIRRKYINEPILSLADVSCCEVRKVDSASIQPVTRKDLEVQKKYLIKCLWRCNAICSRWGKDCKHSFESLPLGSKIISKRIHKQIKE